MILLTRLNQEPFMVNCDLIEYIEENPDTTISMTSGRKFLVSEPAAEVRRRVIDYKRETFVKFLPQS